MELDMGLATAFGAGLLSFLSPCVLPLVPPYLCFLAGASLEELTRAPKAATTGRALARAGAFVLGFGIVFVAFGAAATALGGFVSRHVVLLSQIAGVIIVVLGLHMLGAFRWLLLMREARVQVASRPASLAGAFVVGLAFAFGWSPCVGPVLASILMVAGMEDAPGRGATLLGAYAAGIGLPFLAAALFTGPFLRWLAGFRRHLGAVEKTMGAALVATGILVFLGLMPVLAGWLLDAVPALGLIG
ncbi:cytochrome c biogenesis CcdA family protein [Salinarimonas chemoclinalis]|uniref:cytochrome c biogenesis CcdA family protein n=1 Tax=Salinarimonas chemoclinalis TaxID=3241599 RepID=UPI0035564BF8